MDHKSLKQAVDTLTKVAKASSDSGKKQLVGNDQFRIVAVVSTHKAPATRLQMIKIPLPHAIWGKEHEICFIGRDYAKDLDESHALLDEALKKAGVTCLSKVLTYQQLVKEYQPVTAKQNLSRSLDVLLADAKYTKTITKVLGKHFRRGTKRPLFVNTQKKANLGDQFETMLKRSSLIFNGKGLSGEATVGSSALTLEQNTNNLEAFITGLEKISGGQANVKSVCVHLAQPHPATSISVFQQTAVPEDIEMKANERLIHFDLNKKKPKATVTSEEKATKKKKKIVLDNSDSVAKKRKLDDKSEKPKAKRKKQ